MATDTVLVKRAMLESFKQKAMPTGFLSGFFRTPPSNITDKKKVVIDVKRNEEMIAVDVIRSTAGNLNTNKRFTTKEYEPPMYDEYASCTSDELLDRLPGQPEYSEMSNAAQLIAKITDDQIELQEKILRSIEKQASDVLFTGTNVLINNDTIDFKMKGTHKIAAATAWATIATSTPIDDLIGAANVNRKDGKVESDICVMGEDAFKYFMASTQVQAIGNLRRIDRLTITPPVMNTDGAAFHGEVSVGAYRMQIWTYPQYYYVPVGFGLSNEGTLQPYVPTDQVLVTSSRTQFDLVYAGIPDVVNRVEPSLAAMGITAMPTNVRADFRPYRFTDIERAAIKYGVRSAPLCIPTQIDGYSIIDTTP